MLTSHAPRYLTADQMCGVTDTRASGADDPPADAVGPEHWVVVRGTAEVTVGEEVHIVHEDESVFIPIGTVHRLANSGRIPIELIEVQSGSHLGEDDTARLKDVYNRNN